MRSSTTEMEFDKTSPGPRFGDFGVREEHHRMGINRKIRFLKKEMQQRSVGRYPVSDPMKYQDILLKMKERINESL